MPLPRDVRVTAGLALSLPEAAPLTDTNADGDSLEHCDALRVDKADCEPVQHVVALLETAALALLDGVLVDTIVRVPVGAPLSVADPLTDPRAVPLTVDDELSDSRAETLFAVLGDARDDAVAVPVHAALTVPTAVFVDAREAAALLDSTADTEKVTVRAGERDARALADGEPDRLTDALPTADVVLDPVAPPDNETRAVDPGVSDAIAEDDAVGLAPDEALFTALVDAVPLSTGVAVEILVFVTIAVRRAEPVMGKL